MMCRVIILDREALTVLPRPIQIDLPQQIHGIQAFCATCGLLGGCRMAVWVGGLSEAAGLANTDHELEACVAYEFRTRYPGLESLNLPFADPLQIVLFCISRLLFLKERTRQEMHGGIKVSATQHQA